MTIHDQHPWMLSLVALSQPVIGVAQNAAADDPLEEVVVFGKRSCNKKFPRSSTARSTAFSQPSLAGCSPALQRERRHARQR